MYRFMHQDRVGVEDGLERTGYSPEYEEECPLDPNHQPPPSNLLAAGQENDERRVPRPDRTKPYYSISSV